jgi:hypothetical protein
MKMRHFTLQDLTASPTAALHGLDNTPPCEAERHLEALVEQVLDPLREAWGGPIYVTSGYRCPALNRLVGGVEGSQHTLGQAADITAGKPADNQRLLRLIKRLRLPVDQVIDERHGTWLHVSHGPRNRKQFLHIP